MSKIKFSVCKQRSSTYEKKTKLLKMNCVQNRINLNSAFVKITCASLEWKREKRNILKTWNPWCWKLIIKILIWNFQCLLLKDVIEIETRPRPIIVKFSNYKFREQVFKNKKLLRGTDVVIREDLCDKRFALVNKPVEKFCCRRVWTVDATVFLKCKNCIVRVTNPEMVLEVQ